VCISKAEENSTTPQDNAFHKSRKRRNYPIPGAKKPRHKPGLDYLYFAGLANVVDQV
jgi:hypothetical protein